MKKMKKMRKIDMGEIEKIWMIKIGEIKRI